ncbi:MAG: TIGR02300 family protein [Rhodobacter sp.]|nr:TIGR02300 family protein [Rhodobacter sp.]
MPKEEWGTKRVCPTTGKRFYDLNKDPIVSPYTGDVVSLDTGTKQRTAIVEKVEEKAEEEDLVLVEDDDAVLETEDESEVDIEDDILEEDDDNVSLDDIADVATEEDDS